MNEFTLGLVAVLSLEIVPILLLTLMPRLGGIGKELTEACTKAPLLALILLVMLPIPWLVAYAIAGWWSVIATVFVQIGVMQLWCFIHELSHRSQVKKGSRIYHFMNRRFSWWQNNLALWTTAIVVPIFFAIRFAEVFIYPVLIWTLQFPRYKQSDWINVSRQKFQGLVGQDLVWCLYCDWMTGVYSLGAEMLRNVESFWCPIRFYDGKKCENCKLDFPDLEGGWVAATGTMDDVERVLEEKYSGENRSWFGHPDRNSNS